jgi:HTH-type transcriptional regulator / antitoxin HigA
MPDAILDECGEDKKHPVAELADAITVFMEKSEAEHVPVHDLGPAAVVKFSMSGHRLRQSDLPEIGTEQEALFWLAILASVSVTPTPMADPWVP